MRRSTRLWLSALLLTLGLVATCAEGASAVARALARTDQAQTDQARTTSPGPERPPVPRERLLPRAMRGAAAIEALGSRLEDAASRSNIGAPRLRAILRNDSTAWVSPVGQVYYRESAAPSSAGSTVLAAPTLPTSQTFRLHSRPGAARTIFLDADGATVQDTGWNLDGGRIASGSHIGWDSDGSPSTFSTAEHAWIQEVWRQVAETYSPFDVDVTTEDPGVDAIRRSTSADPTYGTHVVITSSPTPKAQLCGGCLGAAYIGTFDAVDPRGYVQPAWVFADDPRMDPMIAAQAVSHETGHTTGLGHDGTTTGDYYAGTSAWGPIMGSATMRALSQFSKGEYSGASNTQDDFAVMAATGLPRRADDHGDTTGTARELGALATYAVDGVISTRADNDTFAIQLPCTTDLVVSATGVGAQTTLDLALEVLDSSGRVISGSSPASSRTGYPPVSTGMNAAVTVPNATGGYFLRVDGVGNGSPSGSGWSDYGSLGQYRLVATGCGPGTPTPTEPAPIEPAPTEPTPIEPDPHVHPSTVPVTSPSAPLIGKASSGRRGGRVTATVRWTAPRATGGAAITGYRIRALKLSSRNRVVRVLVTSYVPASARRAVLRLGKGRYAFQVSARNRAGVSPWSARSRVVSAR